jgi:hypothetical protein
MRNALALSIALAAVALPAPEARAQIGFSISPYVGLHLHDDGAIAYARGEGEPEAAIEVDAGRFLGAKLGVRFMRRLWVEGDIGFASLNGEVQDAGDLEDAEVDGRLSLYSVALGFDLSPNDKLSAVALLGVGGATTDFDLSGVDSFTDVIVTAGLAASYPVWGRVRVRGDVRSVVEFCDRPDEEEFASCLEDASLTHVEASGGLRFDL